MNPELIYLVLTGAASTPSTSAGDIWTMILKAGPMVKSVMVLLLAFSLVSWAIIIFKSFQLSKARRESLYFLELFWKSRSLSAIYGDARHYKASPVAEIFRVGYQELNRVRKGRNEGTTPEGKESGPVQVLGLENVNRALRRAVSAESTRLSRTISFLATTGNTTPFIGLFGTVWGIMSSFHDIGLSGAANLAVVAPGISEALVATAAGLAAAIPAVVAYNHFSSRVRVLESEMTNFAADFLNIVERDLMRKSGR